MFCKNCGRQMEDGENYCPVCGTMNSEEKSASVGTVTYDLGGVNAANDRMKDEMAGQVFKWGLMSLIFSASFCLSLLGFIFSFVAKSKVNTYRRTFGEISGRANAGRILGRIGFGLGLGMSIFFVFYVFMIGVAVLVEMGMI